MPVEKSVDLYATGASVEAAVIEAVERASLTLRGLKSFEVVEVGGTVDDDGTLAYRVLVRIWFTIKEQVHE